MRPIFQHLPAECQHLEIAPRHKVLLEHVPVGNEMWVVLLTDMQGDNDKAWRMTKKEYWDLQPKHECRDRYVRAWMEPIFQGEKNPPKPQKPIFKMMMLSLI